MDSSYLSSASTFSFSYTPGQTGAFNLRVQITGGPWNIGGVSPTDGADSQRHRAGQLAAAGLVELGLRGP